ncbi:hypothetical protein EMGR_006325 [Emarellia grisea]
MSFNTNVNHLTNGPVLKPGETRASQYDAKADRMLFQFFA